MILIYTHRRTQTSPHDSDAKAELAAKTSQFLKLVVASNSDAEELKQLCCSVYRLCDAVQSQLPQPELAIIKSNLALAHKGIVDFAPPRLRPLPLYKPGQKSKKDVSRPDVLPILERTRAPYSTTATGPFVRILLRALLMKAAGPGVPERERTPYANSTDTKPAPKAKKAAKKTDDDFDDMPT